jgi:hypothetical protein
MEGEKYQFEDLLALMPEGWEEKARELKAFTRTRKLKTVSDLLRLVFLYVTVGVSFGVTSAITQQDIDGFNLVKTAVWKRVRNCVEWLRWLCENIYRNQGLLVEKPGYLGNKRVCLIDVTEDASGGSAANRKFYRLHYCIDLFTLCVIALRLTDRKIGEKVSNFTCFGKDDIVIGDRIYGTIPGIEYLRKSFSGFVLRLRAGAFNLYDRSGRKISLIRRLKGLKVGKTADLEVFYQLHGKLVPLRICAVRKNKSSERKGLERLKHENQRKRQGREVSKVQALYNKYIIVATSTGKEVTAKQVLELYRTRWQIEETFKRLKSIFRYDEIAGKTDESIRAWLYGKLLLSALCESLVNKGRFSPCGQGSDKKQN